ncbi:unnamed protein product [Bursaphelenchus xylophilus]|uniref:ATP-dependent DNA helicase n=2 Tax=Bursaphelenchus xylophilus TaxID=6326 RepID=A0A811LXV6_BURXY|nr:unnamed protein product [Bursaphelenchus xylophilus]CAG9126128.1 unnamed protein product [Bursaphelenchus xylophilus]
MDSFLFEDSIETNPSLKQNVDIAYEPFKHFNGHFSEAAIFDAMPYVILSEILPEDFMTAHYNTAFTGDVNSSLVFIRMWLEDVQANPREWLHVVGLVFGMVEYLPYFERNFGFVSAREAEFLPAFDPRNVIFNPREGLPATVIVPLYSGNHFAVAVMEVRSLANVEVFIIDTYRPVPVFHARRSDLRQYFKNIFEAMFGAQCPNLKVESIDDHFDPQNDSWNCGFHSIHNLYMYLLFTQNNEPFRKLGLTGVEIRKLGLDQFERQFLLYGGGKAAKANLRSKVPVVRPNNRPTIEQVRQLLGEVIPQEDRRPVEEIRREIPRTPQRRRGVDAVPSTPTKKTKSVQNMVEKSSVTEPEPVFAVPELTPRKRRSVTKRQMDEENSSQVEASPKKPRASPRNTSAEDKLMKRFDCVNISLMIAKEEKALEIPEVSEGYKLYAEAKYPRQHYRYMVQLFKDANRVSTNTKTFEERLLGDSEISYVEKNDDEFDPRLLTFPLAQLISQSAAPVGLISPTWSLDTSADPADYCLINIGANECGEDHSDPALFIPLIRPTASRKTRTTLTSRHFVLAIMFKSRRSANVTLIDPARTGINARDFEHMFQTVYENVFCPQTGANPRAQIFVTSNSCQYYWTDDGNFTANYAVSNAELYLRSNGMPPNQVQRWPYGRAANYSIRILNSIFCSSARDNVYHQLCLDFENESKADSPLSPPRVAVARTQPAPRPPTPPPFTPRTQAKGIVRRSQKGYVQKEELKRSKSSKKGRTTMHCQASHSSGYYYRHPYHVGLFYDCPHCQAWLLSGETSSECCKHGQVVMPDLRDMPEFQQNLVLGAGSFPLKPLPKEYYLCYRDESPRLNQMYAFGAQTVHQSDPPGRGAPVVNINGQTAYHVSNPEGFSNTLLLGQLLRFAPDLTDDDVCDQLKKTKMYTNMSHKAAFDALTAFFYNYIRQYNDLAQMYYTIIERQQLLGLEGKPSENYLLKIVDAKDLSPELRQRLLPKDLHERQINKPEVAEHAVVYLNDENGNVKLPPGMVVFSRGHQSAKYKAYMPELDAFLYPLLFIHGEPYFHRHLPLRDVGEDDILPEPRPGDDDEFLPFEVNVALNPLPAGLKQNEDDINIEELEEAADEDDLLPKKTKPKAKKCSLRMQVKYRLQRRPRDRGVHRIYNHYKLGGRWICQKALGIEEQVFDYYEKNVVPKRRVDAKYVRENFSELLKQKSKGYQLGKLTRMPPGHRYSRRYYQRQYSNCIAMAQTLSSPSFFITLTANSEWPDFLQLCGNKGVDPKNAYDILNRVFRQKVVELMRRIAPPQKGQQGWFGQCLGYYMSLEFQKRGNPHVHLLLWTEHKEMSAHVVDEFISARFPDPVADAEVHDKVLRYMIHDCKETDLCRDKNGKCTRRYPQEIVPETRIGPGYVAYQRLERGKDVTAPVHSGSKIVDGVQRVYTDRHVVPYNKTLLTWWDGHSNVEAVCTNGTPAYVLKYILKGNDHAIVQVISEFEALEAQKQKERELEKERQGKLGEDHPFDENEIDPEKKNPNEKIYGIEINPKTKKVDIHEPEYYMGANYITPQEAHLRIFSFGPVFVSHIVEQIGIHMPGDSHVYAADGEPIENIAQKVSNLNPNVYSRLTAYFQYCAENAEETADLTYVELNKNYAYDYKTKTYRKYKKQMKKIVQLREVSVKNKELLALRSIILTVPCLKSFEECRTHEEQIFSTFLEAAQARGLFHSDVLWRHALDQARGRTCKHFVFLFAQVLIEAGELIEDQLQLWNDYKIHMLMPPFHRPNMPDDEIRQRQERRALELLSYYLSNMGGKYESFNLPPLTGTYDPDVHGENEDLFIGEFDSTDRPAEPKKPKVSFGDDQQYAFDMITKALELAPQNKAIPHRQFFLHGAGGTGKTTLYNELIDYCQEQGIKHAATATTGVAANLIKTGQTLHNLIWAPINLDSDTLPTLKYEDQKAQRLRELGLLIIDESSQLNVDLYNYLQRLLRHVRKAGDIDRQLVIVYGGDYQQILPVCPDLSIGQEWTKSLISKASEMQYIVLKQNHRTRADERSYRQFLSEIGSGTNFSSTLSLISLRHKLHPEIHNHTSPQDMIEAVFPQSHLQLGLEDRPTAMAILAPRVQTVMNLNTEILDRFPGKEHVYVSVNTPNPEDVSNFDHTVIEAMQEQICKVNDGNMPPGELKLKVGVDVVLRKNLSVRTGFSNGTRMRVVALNNDLIECQKIDSNGNLGQTALIARSRFDYRPPKQSKAGIRFTRYQFPLQLAFAMSINRAQGQTLNVVGLYLDDPVFSHGQTYVALSRTRRAADIHIYSHVETDEIDNVVYGRVTEFLRDLDKIYDNQKSKYPQKPAGK